MADKYYSKEAIGERIRAKLRPPQATGIQKLRDAIRRRGVKGNLIRRDLRGRL